MHGYFYYEAVRVGKFDRSWLLEASKFTFALCLRHCERLRDVLERLSSLNPCSGGNKARKERTLGHLWARRTFRADYTHNVERQPCTHKLQADHWNQSQCDIGLFPSFMGADFKGQVEEKHACGPKVKALSGRSGTPETFKVRKEWAVNPFRSSACTWVALPSKAGQRQLARQSVT